MTDDLSRRAVLRGLGGLALTRAIGCSVQPDDSDAAVAESSAELLGCQVAIIPAVANRAVAVTGVQAYAQNSVAAGGTIDFRISSDVPYQLSVVRLGWDTDGPSRDWVVQSFPQAAAAARTIHPGSYIHVERAIAPVAQLSQLSLECWVRPFRNAWQGLIDQYTYPTACGYGLFLGDDGRPYVYFGTGGSFVPAWLRAGTSALALQQWHHLVAVFDAGTAQLYVDGKLVDAAGGFPASVTPGSSPLRLGAYGDASGTANFLDGDLAMPVIYARALSAADVAARVNQRPPVTSTDPAVLGCWPLSAETGAFVADASSCARHGTIVNHGTWMIGGPGFNAAAVGRFAPYDPDTDATRGHALRLSSSDLYDCAWPISQSTTIPSEQPPGIYVGRITYGANQRHDVTFVVKRSPVRPPARIVVLCATNTWHAYNAPFGLFSFYQNHAGGQPTYLTGIDLPWASGADPYLIYVPQYNYSHLVRAERFLHVWLEQNGYDFDAISDQDLHDDPGLLGDYRTLFIAGHSEYWSREAHQAVRSYLTSGGHVIMASGNTMFWRVSYKDGMIECRKLPLSVGGRENAQWGELYHEHDHDRGGLMREAGYPEWQALGLECIGYGGPHVPYRVTNPAHALFQSPEPIAVAAQTELGGPFAVGHEWDARLQPIPGGLTPPIPLDYTPVVLAEARSDTDRLDYQCNWISGTNQVISEIVDWTWSSGGSVLSAGSIAAGSALHADRKLAALFRNKLHRNNVVFRLNALAISQDGRLLNKWFDGTSWGPSMTSWEDMGGSFCSAPIGVQWAPGYLAIMAITSTGSFHYRYWDGSVWSAWIDFGPSFQGRPAAVGWGRNRLDLFARGSDNHLYNRAWNGNAWASWIDLGGSVASDPTAIAWKGDNLSVAVRDASSNIKYKWFLNNTWYPAPTTWQDMGGSFAHAPTLFAWGGNKINVFAVDAAGHMHSKHWDGSAWSPSLTTWQDLGGALAGRVAVGMWGPNQFTVFGVGQDGRMMAKWWDGSQWGPSLTGWSDLGGTFSGEPAVASYRGYYLSVVAVDTSGRLMHKLWDGVSWSAWQDMAGSLRASPAIFRSIGP